MGCIKSKQTYAVQNSTQNEKTQTSNDRLPEETAALVVSNEEEKQSERIAPDPVLLDYAHRLSEEIVDTAVKQWAENDSKYSDIPFIESDVPWTEGLCAGLSVNFGHKAVPQSTSELT